MFGTSKNILYENQGGGVYCLKKGATHENTRTRIECFAHESGIEKLTITVDPGDRASGIRLLQRALPGIGRLDRLLSKPETDKASVREA